MQQNPVSSFTHKEILVFARGREVMEKIPI